MKIEQELRDVLETLARPYQLQEEFSGTPIERLKRLTDGLIEKQAKESWKRWRLVTTAVSLLVPLLSGGIGLLFAYSGLASLTPAAKAAFWISFALWGWLILVIAKLMPPDLDALDRELKRINLTRLVERLAAEIALFGLLLNERERLDDKAFVVRVSSMVPPIRELSQAAQAVITVCANPARLITDSRESNIEIAALLVPPAARGRLQGVLEQIVAVSKYMFVGHRFMAKLYLRVILSDSASQEHEILVSFSRFPLKDGEGYGTSWVRAHGRQAIVWQALEQGTFVVQSATNFNKDYESVLAVPLPRRIGVLAITATGPGAFDSVSVPAYKAFALATDRLIRDALATE